jgi:hypothetical protein
MSRVFDAVDATLIFLSLCHLFTARAELDGNRPRAPNPLTIIQVKKKVFFSSLFRQTLNYLVVFFKVKNPEKNLDSGGGGGGGGGSAGGGSLGVGLGVPRFLFFGLSYSRRFCFVASVLMCFVFVAGFLWIVPCGNGNGEVGGIPTCGKAPVSASAYSSSSSLSTAAAAASANLQQLRGDKRDWSRLFSKIGKCC